MTVPTRSVPSTRPNHPAQQHHCCCSLPPIPGSNIHEDGTVAATEQIQNTAFSADHPAAPQARRTTCPALQWWPSRAVGGPSVAGILPAASIQTTAASGVTSKTRANQPELVGPVVRKQLFVFLVFLALHPATPARGPRGPPVQLACASLPHRVVPLPPCTCHPATQCTQAPLLPALDDTAARWCWVAGRSPLPGQL